MARARGDNVEADRWATAVRSIVGRLPADDRQHALVHMIDEDAAAARTEILERPARFAGRFDFVEMALLDLADRREIGSAASVSKIRTYAQQRSLAGTGAQAARAIGIVQRDPTALREALDWFVSADALPFVGRTQTELGILRGDAGLIDEGMAQLEAIGDLRQLEQVARERASGRLEVPDAP
jgi:hypothetical protein